jgi:methyltransferase family protein
MKRLIARPCARRLDWLALVYGSDKRTGHRFAPVYERHLKTRRRQIHKVLEIGVGGYNNRYAGGASLRMWRTYFPAATLYGFDIKPHAIDEPRITFIQGDQSRQEDLEQLAALGPYDLIIDDGSHINEHVLLSFECLWPALAPGGLYVIEDTETAYIPECGGGPPGTPGTSMQLTRELLDEVNRRYVRDTLPAGPEEVAAVHAYANIVLVERFGGPDAALNRY